MSVTVRIKQKGLFKKKLTIDDIIQLTNLSYGVCDENYRLNRGEKADHTLIYDESKLARGIDLSLEGTDIVLILSLPNSPSEIRLFYDVIEKICKSLRTTSFIREEEQVSLNDKERFIEYDEKASVGGLEELRERIAQMDYHRFELFGIYNPISIGAKEIKEIGNSLERLEEFFHRVQSLDVYYATPRVFQVDNRLVGIYVIGPDIPSVLPDEPYIVLNQIEGVKDWYVMLTEGQTVKYDDFIKNAKHQEYYDANHKIVTVSEKEISSLLEKYAVKI